MAEVKKDILMQYTLEFGDTAKRIGEITGKLRELKDEQEALQYEMKSLETGSDEYKALATQLAANTEAQKAYRKELSAESREVQNAIKHDVEYTGSLDAMRARLSTLKQQLGQMTDVFDENGQATGRNADAYFKMRGEIIKLNDDVSKQEQAYGVYSRNVGNYANSIMSALGGIGGKTGKAITGIKGATTAFQAMSKVPIVAVLGLVARALEMVIGGLKGSEENSNRVKAAFGGLQAIADVLKVGLQALGKIIGNIAEGIGRFAARLIESIPALDKVNERMKVRNELAEREIELNKQTRQTSIDVAQEELAISELRAKAAEKDRYTASERLAFLEEALTREENISRHKYELAKQEYELVRDQNAQTESSKEELDREAEAQVKMLNAQKEYYEFSRSVQRQMQSAKKEIAAEDKARREEEQAAEKERIDALRETAQQMSEAYKRIRDAALGDSEEYRMQAVKDKYAAMYRDIAENALMQADEKMYYSILLAGREQEELNAIQQEGAKKREDAEAKTAKERTDAQKKMYDDALQLAWNDADAQYEIRRTEIERELALAEYGTAERARLEQQLAELMSQHDMARIAALEDYVSKVQTLASEIVAIMQTADKKELNSYKAANQKKKEDLQARYEAGLVSKDEYDYQVSKMDEEMDRRQLEIERRQAERQKLMSAFEIAVNTAAAIMKIWAEVPKADFGVSTGILTALAAATGAAQLAAVLAEPLPMARKGGLVQGATHEQGGVLVNTEGGERIVSRDASRAFPELLNLISYIGKHTGAVPSTGYVERQAVRTGTAGVMQMRGAEIDYERLAAAIAKQPVFLSLRELRTAEGRQTRIVQSAKL